MSTPYFIHKKDADRYDAIQKELEPLQEEYRKTDQALHDELSRRYEEIYAKHGGIVNSISGMDMRPLDLENYFTYYRGIRWGEASSKDMNIIDTIPDWARKKE